MLSTSMILAARWLSVDHLTSEPTKTGAKDSRSRFLQLLLLGGSEGSTSAACERFVFQKKKQRFVFHLYIFRTISGANSVKNGVDLSIKLELLLVFFKLHLSHLFIQLRLCLKLLTFLVWLSSLDSF